MVYKAALIGCGKIGSRWASEPMPENDVITHAEAYSLSPETKLIAICDTDPLQLYDCGSRWNVDAQYSNVKAMMDTAQPELVSICTPDASHYDVLCQIFSADHKPLGILCEKPLAIDVRQARTMVETCEMMGIVLAVSYLRRYANNINSVKSFISKGNLGSIQAVGGWYTKGIYHNGTHWIDLLRFLVGEITWVLGLDTFKEAIIDPPLDAILGLENGSLATLRAVREQYFSIFEMEILGTKGRIQITDSGFKIDLSLPARSRHYSGYFELDQVDSNFGDRKNLVLHAITDLVRSVRDGGRPACTGIDGLTAIKVARAIQLSSQEERKILLND